MDKIPVTSAGYARMEAELKDLKTVQRPEIIQAISTAREHGDLSENAEYHSAREQQSFIEGRILDLEGRVSYADVIDSSKLGGSSVKFSATVTVVDEDTDEEHIYQIVGEYEADLENGMISITSPIARALIGKTVDDSIEVKTPKGSRAYEILKVEYK